MAIRGLVCAILPLVFACSSKPPPSIAPSATATSASLVATASAADSSEAPAPLLPAPPDANPPQIGQIGELALEGGDVIHDCRVEYRVLGAANADKSNVVVWATWFSGVTQDLLELVGPGKLVDSAKYEVVLVGALANGASSSPSNSPLQPRARFPQITVRDMVNSQHQLLTHVLGISRVRAVMGISMGGMQTFQWGLSYPDFMDRLIPIVGSPRLAPYDLLLWQTNLDAVEQNPEFLAGNYRQQPVLSVVQQLADLNLTTPGQFNTQQTRESVVQAHEKLTPPRFDANDRIRQLRAMMAHDVTKPFAGSLHDAALAVKAKLLVVVNEHDAMVTPGPALDFAKLAKAQTLILDDDCGHKAPSCETATIGKAIAHFLR